MNDDFNKSKAVLGFMFFISGFSALLYQTVWLRLAFAEFGVIAPVVSLIVTAFMLGLGFGSWIGGRCVAVLKRSTKRSAITIYGGIELFIGLGAFILPQFFHYGAAIWTSSGEMNSWLYLLTSAVVIIISILPFAMAMGMTYPAVLEFLREDTSNNQDTRSFGFLYTANTLGACLGALATVFILVEILGFTKTLTFGALGNFLIAFIAIRWGAKAGRKVIEHTPAATESVQAKSNKNQLRSLVILFTTGFCSMAMEVVWIRSFTPILGTLVYSFAILLAGYLFSNWFGAFIYRGELKRKRIMSQDILIALSALFASLPLLASNPNFFKPLLLNNAGFAVLLLCLPMSIMPFSAILGYLTPLIIDDWSGSDPIKAGKAYAINILGCVLGPLLAGYLILPLVGARISLILLIIPLLILNLAIGGNQKAVIKLATIIVSCLILFNACFWQSWEEGGLIRLLGPGPARMVISRDYAATTTSFEINHQKRLLVNGQGMTDLCRATKYMAHIPLALHKEASKSTLIICFGMGTTYRSALSWGDSKVTVVELVPGVVRAFNYYYPDAKTILNNPNGRIVIDDGRRFLRRTTEKFDVIIIDPPPPLASSASGLLYSKEFFELIKNHLNPGGILDQWFGYDREQDCMLSMLQALRREFQYIRRYPCLSDPGAVGWYFLASDSPIDSLTSTEFYDRLPQKAKGDLMERLATETSPYDLRGQIKKLLAAETPVNTLLASQNVDMLTDDYPLNEYCLLRSITGRKVYLEF